jgi:SAM-dependent methyltransferase
MQRSLAATSADAGLDHEFRRRLERSSTDTVPVLEAGTSYAHEDGRIADAIRSMRKPDGPVRILEAGCGNRWPIDLGNLDYHLVGVDFDAEALRIRTTVRKDLHEAIVGDLCTTPLPAASFDVVYSAFVLEHIERADLALENMIQALKPGGLLVIRLPDPQSARGFVTRRTPFWFHVFFAKYVEKRPNAGQPGYAPYPTHYHRAVWKDSLLAMSASHGLRCFWMVADNHAREEKGALGSLARGAAHGIGLMSFGNLSSSHTNLIYFLRKSGG